MKANIDKLYKLISQTPPKWREKAQWRKDNAYWTKIALNISLKLNAHILDNNIDLHTLSTNTDISVENINKMCEGGYNFTIQEICSLQNYLKIKLI